MSTQKTAQSAGFEVRLTIKAATQEDARRVVDAALAATTARPKETK